MAVKEVFALGTPPSGDYDSGADSGNSEWDGSFTYDDDDPKKPIVYTTDAGDVYDTHNQSKGNALVFSIPDHDPPGCVRWELKTPGSVHGKAQYKGLMHDPNNKTAGQQSWTATQT